LPSPFDCISTFIFVETPLEKADILFIPGESHVQLMGRAAQLFHQGFAPFILPSGGFNPRIPQYKSEWEFLQKLGLQQNVPEKAILKEDKSQNTYENAVFSRNVLLKKNLPVDKAILVCKAFHSRRALLTYQSVFRNTTFFVSPVTDYRGITKENWFTRKDYIAVVMGEVRKIGEYFEEVIPEWAVIP